MFHKLRGWLRPRRSAPLGLQPTHVLHGTLPVPHRGGLGFDDLVRALRLARGRQRPFVVVQIGACDGELRDPLTDVLNDPSITYIAVEPVAEAFERLQRRHGRRDRTTLIRAAIVREGQATEIVMYRFSREACAAYPDWFGTSSLLREHLENSLSRNRNKLPPELDLAGAIVEERVPTLSGRELKDRLGSDQVDALLVDTEGYDHNVLASLFGVDVKPSVLQYEHRFLSDGDKEATVRLLQTLGYLLESSWEDTVGLLIPE